MTIVLVVAATLLFSGGLTGNASRYQENFGFNTVRSTDELDELSKHVTNLLFVVAGYSGMTYFLRGILASILMENDKTFSVRKSTYLEVKETEFEFLYDEDSIDINIKLGKKS